MIMKAINLFLSLSLLFVSVAAADVLPLYWKLFPEHQCLPGSAASVEIKATPLTTHVFITV